MINTNFMQHAIEPQHFPFSERGTGKDVKCQTSNVKHYPSAAIQHRQFDQLELKNQLMASMSHAWRPKSLGVEVLWDRMKGCRMPNITLDKCQILS